MSPEFLQVRLGINDKNVLKDHIMKIMSKIINTYSRWRDIPSLLLYFLGSHLIYPEKLEN